MTEHGLTEEEALIVGYEEGGSYVSTPLTKIVTSYGIESREYALAVAGTLSHAIIALINKNYPRENNEMKTKLLSE